MNDSGENGIALVAVLWLLILLAVVAAALSFETHSNVRVARNMSENASARMAADAGIQRAILDLQAAVRAPGDAGQLRVDGTVYTWRFAECTVRLSIQDQLGKVNLNQAPEALLAALITSTGVVPAKAQALADAIADFRDPDNLRRPHGAERAEYEEAGQKWGPANAPFQTVEELQQVLGMTPEIYQRLAPDLTTYTLGMAVNTGAAGERLSRILRAAGFRYFGPQAIRAYSIRAEATTSRGSAFVREAVVQFPPEGDNPAILSWQQSALTH